jgi:hypothetical protein
MKVILQQDGEHVNMLSHLSEPVFLDTKNYDKGQSYQSNIINEVKKANSKAILVAIKNKIAEVIACDSRYDVTINMGMVSAPVLPTVEHIEQVLKTKEAPTSFPPLAKEERPQNVDTPRYEIVYSEEALEKINPTKKLEMISDHRPPIKPKAEVAPPPPVETLPEPITLPPERLVTKVPIPGKTKQKEKEKNVMSAKDQISLIRESIRHVLNSQMQHGGLICGGSGLGKSFLIEDILENDFGLKRDLDFIVYKGSMTEAGLYKVLAKYHDKIIVLDDCDSVWGDKNAINMLKGGLEATPPKVNKKGFVYDVEYALDIRHEDGEVTESIFKAEFADADTEEMATRLFHLRISSNLGKSEGFRILKLHKRSVEFSIPLRFVSKVSAKGNSSSPVKVSGKILFVSNLNPEDINEAVKTRMEVCTLDLTREQVIEYIDAIKHHIMPHVTNDALKIEILDLYRENVGLQLDLRTFAIAIDKAEKNPEKWREMLLFKK